MFDNLTDRLSCTFRNISGRGRLTEDNIKETLHEVRVALLEADVALPVVREFIQSVKENAINQNVNKSLTPGQEFIKIVHNQLTNAMGKENSSLNLAVQPPAVILVVGMKGVGKTTTIAKLGKLLKEKQKKKVLIVSTDIYRPAGIKQLEILTQTAGIDFFPSTSSEKPIKIATNALRYAKLKFYDILIIDTSGCLDTNEIIMLEIQEIYRSINPIETLFIIDAMTGQNSANTAKSFDEKLLLTGFILTKIDGDARGGAALSIRYITGKPIKFLGTGEEINNLEPFYPDRISSRILGMGDILSFIEEIESKVNSKKTEKFVHKLKRDNNFDLNDFLEQLKQMHNIGNMTTILNKIPGISKLSGLVKLQIDNKILVKMEAIISSMTTKERQKPEIIKGSRKKRIAAGSGTQVQDINRLLKQFNDIRHIIKKMKKNEITKIISGMKNIKLFDFKKKIK
ncbi:MAG: signal recognition particle protein [Arsenophonus sp. ET-DL9-MAG3]